VRVLITGSEGFAGRHLTEYLLSTQDGAEILGTVYKPVDSMPYPIQYQQVDLLETESVKELLDSFRPDAIYHLAAQASPSVSLHAAWRTLEVNIRAQLNLFECCIHLGIRPRILITSSAEIYRATPPVVMPLTEETELRPTNPYALSKITQDYMGLQYFISHALPIIRVRPFNHTGPGQSETFVAPDFAFQIARIEAGLQPARMGVGNLSAQRDFTDVRDTIRAYYLLMQHGIPGEAYNVASNQAHSIQSLLDTLLAYTSSKIEVYTDTTRLRPVDIPVIRGDSSKLHRLTGWNPVIPFEKTLRDLLDECRQRIQRTN
jgi:GDP-4-dehydro-6-deoxy-D-mannose reductase